MNAVDVQGLSHIYPPQRRGGEARRALTDLSFSVRPGEIFGLLGPNGGGKTTLFRILSTSLKATGGGSAAIFGADVGAASAAVRRKIGVVFQNPSLDGKLTVAENLRTHSRLYGLSGADAEVRITDALARVNLADRADDFVETLSGGLQRRGEIAKSLLHKPELLLMDEPSTGLDPGARRDLWDILLKLRDGGATVLLTTHLMEEAERCERVAIIAGGRLLVAGKPDELRSRIGGDIVTVQTADPVGLADKVRQKFQIKASPLDGTVRLEINEGHKFIPLIVEAFPGQVAAVSVGKPTLEDVFIRETGRSWAAEPS